MTIINLLDKNFPLNTLKKLKNYEIKSSKQPSKANFLNALSVKCDCRGAPILYP